MATNRKINWLIAIALAGWLLYLLAPILTPFVASALFAYLGDPLADRLQRLRLPRSLTVVVVFVLTIALLALLVLLVGPLVQQQIAALVTALPDIARSLEEVWLPKLAPLLDVDPDSGLGFGAFLSRYSEMAGEWGSMLLASVSRGGSALATAVISLFLIPILTFYLLRDWDAIVVRLGSLVPESQQAEVFALAQEIDRVLGAFLRGQLLVMLALALMYSLGLSLAGVDYAIAIGVVAGLVSFVPYLGLVFGLGLAAMTVLLEPAPLWPLLGVVATFTVAQFLEAAVLTPKLVGDQIGLHPVIVIFAVAAGGQLFGLFGILLALPAAAVLSVLTQFAYRRYLREHPEAALRVESLDRHDGEQA